MINRKSAAQNTARSSWLTSALLALGMIMLLAGTPTLADPIVASYEIPEFSSGLAWDGSLLWIGGIGDRGNWIRAFDPVSGQIVDSIAAPVRDCLGLAWVGDRLAYLSPRSDTTYFVTRDGSVPAFENPIANLGGLGSQGSTLWAATYSEQNGTLLRVDEKGQVLLSMPYTGRHSRDAAYHRGRVWIADRLAQEVREVNPESGRFVRTIPTPAVNPDGLTSDGEYLWLSDDGEDNESDRLYKILALPDGNIRLSSLRHNYGSVVIDEEVDWDLWIYNDGARRAGLSDFQIRNGNEDIFTPHVWAFPDDLAGGDSARFRVTFRPAWEDSVRIEFGLTYDVDEQTYWVDLRGNGVRPHRDLVVPERVLDFGQTRCGALVNGSNMRYLLIENNGGEPLTIEALNFSHESFFHGYYEFPYTFEQPGLYRIPIFFRPDRNENISYHESVTIVSDDPDSPQIRVMLEGTTLLINYNGGVNLWAVQVGNRDMPVPRARALEGIDDVTGDGLADVVIASNDFLIRAYHAASTQVALPIWTYETNANPWRQGLVVGPRGMSSGDDWDGDGVGDLVIGLEGGAMSAIALSGRTGEEIWIFDTHGMRGSGGHVIVAQGEDDFTSDGIRDVIIAVAEVDDQHTTNAIVLLNGQTGEIVWFLLIDEAPVDCWTLEDFNADGINDLVVLEDDGEVLGIDGRRGRIVWESSVEGRIRNMFPLLGDANGDGSVDVSFVSGEAGITVLNGSNGVQLWNNRVFDDLQVGIPVNDVNGNGTPDIVYGDDSLIRAIDGGTGTAAWDTTVYVGSRTAAMETLMDYDRDGYLDYLVGTASGRLYAYSGNGVDGLWSFSNVAEGHGFVLVKGVRDIDGNGEMDIIAAMENGTVYCFSGSYVGANDVPEVSRETLPQIFMLDPAYPNPFNSSVIVPVNVSQTSNLTVKIYNLLGQQVYQRQTLPLAPGRHQIFWNGSTNQGTPLPSGLYYLEVQSPLHRATRPVELLR